MLETCRKSSSIPALLGERRFYFTVFPFFPFPFHSRPSFCVLYNMTREHLKFLRSTIVEIFDIVSILDSITGRIFKKKKKIWILRIFDTTRRYDFREIKF